MTNSMTKYVTVFEATRNLPRFIEIGHGETADLYTSITDCGIPVALSGYSISALYQPSSKWGTSEYYNCPLEIDGNEVIIHWSHAQDNGDSGVKMWVSFTKDGELSYPALYKIGLFQTPGFEPSPITPIPEVLDFSQYTLLNAPWSLQTDFNSLSTAIGNPNSIVRQYENDIGYSQLVHAIRLTNRDDEYPWLEFDDSANGGDYWVFGTNGGSSGLCAWHELYLPVGTGTLVLDGDLVPLSNKIDVLSTDVSGLIHTIGDVSERIRYAQTNTLITQNNQNVQLYEREDRGITVLSDSVASNIILSLPSKDADFVGDFIVDIDNRKQSALSVDLNGDPSAFYWFAVDEGESLSSVLTAEKGKITRLYFTTPSATRDYMTIPLPVIHISKKVIEVVGHSEV